MSSARVLSPEQIGPKLVQIGAAFREKGKGDSETLTAANRVIAFLTANCLQWNEVEKEVFRREYGGRIQKDFPENLASAVSALVRSEKIDEEKKSDSLTVRTGVKWPGYFFFQVHPENKTWDLLRPCVARMRQPGFDPYGFLDSLGKMLSSEETPRYKKALKYLQIAMKDKDLSTFSSRKLLELMKKINEALVPDGGAFKTKDTLILNQGQIPTFHPPYEEVPGLMEQFAQQLSVKLKTEQDPFRLMSFVHQEFIRIHPFSDGNGRLARILMNLIGYQRGLHPILIDSSQRYEGAIRSEEQFAKYLQSLHVQQSKIYSDPLFTGLIDLLLKTSMNS